MKKLGLGFIVVLLLAGMAAYATGYAGWAAGFARTKALPKDHKMLRFFDVKTSGVGLVQFPLAKMPKDEGMKTKLDGIRKDLEEVSGIRIPLDVDTVAIGDKLIAARGRFNWPRLEENLKEHNYVITNEHGRPIALREDTGEALTLQSGYLLHGKADQVIAAMDRFDNDEGLKAEHSLVKYIDMVGWRHAMVGALKLSDDKLSFSEALTGASKMRAAMLAVDYAGEDFPLTFYLVPGSNQQAQGVKDMLSEGRDDLVRSFKKSTKSEEVALRKSLEAAQITIENDQHVRLTMVLPGVVVDAAMSEGRNMTKTLDRSVRSFAGPFMGMALKQLLPR